MVFSTQTLASAVISDPFTRPHFLKQRINAFILQGINQEVGTKERIT